MHKNIYLPFDWPEALVVIHQVHIQVGQRIRRNQALLHVSVEGKAHAIPAPCDGWIRFVATKEGDPVEGGSLLVIIDAMDVADYRPDASEVNPHTELGEAGRRGAERAGQRDFTNGYATELFDAPEERQGSCQRQVKEHPLLNQMKEGVPPKMSNARNNQPATERLAEDAAQDPELANQLSMSLQAELGISPGPSTSPTLKAG